MLNKNNIFYLLILIAISFLLRVYMVDQLPLGVLPDEASIGYNAYSILKTGKDEHGISYPLIFKAFGDEKLPAYIYASVPSIKLFGLNNFSIRLPSVIAGTLIALGIFFLLLELGFTNELSFIGALISSTSQWSIILSRFTFESNIGLLFLIMAILSSLFGIKKNKLIPIVLSGIFFGLTWYSYIAYRIVSPLIILALLIIYMKKNRFINKQRIILLVVFIGTISPLLLFTNQKPARFKQAGYNNNLGTVLEINENRMFCTQYLPKIICYANANKILFNSRILFYRYLTTFSPDYLFMNGEKNDKYLNVDHFGLLPIIFLPFYLLGLIYLWHKFVNKKLSRNEVFLILGLLISPLPSLLVGDPQKIRLSALLPFLVILITYGFYYLKDFLNKYIINLIYSLISFITLLFALFFIVNFLAVHVQKYETSYYTYVYKLMRYISKFDKKTSIYIKSIPESPILYAFINKTDPMVFQKSAVRKKADSIGFTHVVDFDNLLITEGSIEEIYCQSMTNSLQSTKTLYITNENLIKVGKIKKAINIILSENKVDTLAFVYDIEDINKINVNCNYIINSH